jgi:hypothetical protein
MFNKSQNTTNAVYFFDGKVNLPAQKSETTIEKNGKFYEQFESMNGFISDVQVVDGYEAKTKDMIIFMSDDQDTYQIRFGVKSAYFRSFSRIFPNIELSKEVYIYPTQKTVEGEKKNGLVVKQGEVWLKRYYTMDNMENMPIAIPIEINGKTEYDYSDQNEFLISQIDASFAELK